MLKKTILIKLSIFVSSTLCYGDSTLENLNFYNNSNSYTCITSPIATKCFSSALIQNIAAIRNGNPLKAIIIDLSTSNDYLQSSTVRNTKLSYSDKRTSYLENFVVDGTGLINPILNTSNLELSSYSLAGRDVHVKNLEIKNSTLKIYDNDGGANALVRWRLRIGNISDFSTSYIILNNGHLDIQAGGDIFSIENPSKVILESYGTSSITNWFSNNPIDTSFLFNINTGSTFSLNTNGSILRLNNGAANIYGGFILNTSGFNITPNSEGFNIYDNGVLTLNSTNFTVNGKTNIRGSTPIFNIDNNSTFDISNFDFRIDSTTPTSSDKLTFSNISSHDNQQISLNNKVKIEINPMTIGTVPSDYDGKVFKVIDNPNLGTTYTNTQINTMYEFVAGANLPVLTDLTLGTDNNYDLVLTGATLPINSLKTHKAVNTINKTAGVSLLLNAVNTNTSPSITSSINSLTNGQASSSIDSIHAEPYSSFITVGLEQIDLVISSVQDKTEKHFSTNKNFWLDMSYLDGEVNGDNNLGNFDYKLKTFLFGSDILKNENINIGVFLGYGNQSMSEHDSANQSFASDNFHLGMYAYNKVNKNSHLSAMMGYSYGKNSTERNVILTSLSNENKAEYNSHSLYSSLKFTYDINSFESIKISPSIGLNYAYYKQDKITEEGNDSRLIIDKADSHMIVSSIALDAKFNSFENYKNLFPLMFVRYEHDWYANKNKEHSVNAALAISPNYKESFVGQNRGANSLHFGLGLESKSYNNFDISGGLVKSFSDVGEELSFAMNIKYKF